MITDAERRFPFGVRVAVPPDGFGQRFDGMHAWLDQNCSADGWLIAPAGLRGVVNGAVAIDFRGAALAAAFVPRWCEGRLPEIADGAFVVRDDDPVVRRSAPLHKTL